jgi:hypothetical protein
MNAGAQDYVVWRQLTYQRARVALSTGMTLSSNDRRLAWESARDDAHLAFRLWCEAPLTARRDAYAVYRAAADREDMAVAALMTA